jgi:N-acetylglucosamine-6-phosphate deacetylase
MMGRLIPGYLANIVVFDEDFDVKGLFIRGKQIRNNFNHSQPNPGGTA